MYENLNATELQLLSMDLGSMDTSFPIADPGIYDLRVTKSEITPVRDATKGNMWKLTFENTTPVEAKRGQVASRLEPGSLVLFDQAILNPMGKAKWDQVMAGVAKLVQALKLNGATLPTIESWHKQAEGKVVRARVSIAPQRTDPITGATYSARNQIDEYPRN